MDFEKIELPAQKKIHSPDKRNPKRGKIDKQQASSPTLDTVTSPMSSNYFLWA
jgi:hypothetical protein